MLMQVKGIEVRCMVIVRTVLKKGRKPRSGQAA